MGAVSSSLYKGHRYSAAIISYCVWLYHRFPLSFREVEAPHFRPRRHRLHADAYRREMTSRFTTWNEVAGLPTAS